MSIVNQGKPSRIRSVYGNNTTNAVGVVYTCPPNSVAEITFIHVVNGSVTTNTATVEWYIAADTFAAKFLYTKSLTSTSSHVSFNNINLVLQPGDKIQVTPGNAGSIDTIITVTETFIPVG
jgi:hypothetical protein|tara:strand:- start:2724 stop:3086 length:363 start_codon:yes stop_codon:yes gene_type:complete